MNLRPDIERDAICRELRSAATLLESRAFMNIPMTMREAADELETLGKVVSKRKLRKLRKAKR